MRFAPYIAALVVCATVGIAHFAFPAVETRTVTVKADPFKGMTSQRQDETPITTDFLVRCEYFGNRPGIVEGVVPPKETDLVLVRCQPHRIGPSAPVG